MLRAFAAGLRWGHMSGRAARFLRDETDRTRGSGALSSALPYHDTLSTVTDYDIGPARQSETWRIANMSRALIEDGLTWRWRPTAVARLIRREDVEVVCVRANGLVVGFAVMQFFDDEAHLV